MEDETKITLRIPTPLHKRLVALANAERRSLNAQIVVMLERAPDA